MSTVEHFVDISLMTAEQAAAQVQAFGVHVLFNLNGWTRGARTEIFAYKPAPVQVIAASSTSSGILYPTLLTTISLIPELVAP